MPNIINASHAILEGGTISIEGKIEDDIAIVDVTDTGVGISKENLERIFEPFFTTKLEGKGQAWVLR